MLQIHATNPDESIIASIAWNLWTEGRLGADLLAGVIPGIEHHVYWTQPLYYVVLAGWVGLWGLSLLSVRTLPMVLAAAVLLLLYCDGRLHRRRAAWLASLILPCSLYFDYASSLGRMDMLAIALTTAAVCVVGVPDRQRRHTAAAGALAALAFLTHPLGAAAGVAVLVTIAIRDRASLPLVLAGALPLMALWILYICIAPATYAAQMGLQLTCKAGNPHSPIHNLEVFLGFCGACWPVEVMLWIGGGAGLLLERHRNLPWLATAICLCPVVIFLGEVAYPAYLAPAAAVGLATLAGRLRWGPHLLAAAILARFIPVVPNPLPLAGFSDITPHGACSASATTGSCRTDARPQLLATRRRASLSPRAATDQPCPRAPYTR
ncbi:MAG: glycosyltransferase family 39 protein [bacterium]|nr:glycosyltransferase family 39 protein [bacterium]